MPELVLRRRAGPFQFGFEMGTGVRTFVPSSAPYVVLAALVLLGPGLAATLAAAAGFGAARAAVPYLRLLAADREGWERAVAASSAAVVRAGTVGAAVAVALTPSVL